MIVKMRRCFPALLSSLWLATACIDTEPVRNPFAMQFAEVGDTICYGGRYDCRGMNAGEEQWVDTEIDGFNTEFGHCGDIKSVLEELRTAGRIIVYDYAHAKAYAAATGLGTPPHGWYQPNDDVIGLSDSSFYYGYTALLLGEEGDHGNDHIHNNSSPRPSNRHTGWAEHKAEVHFETVRQECPSY